MNVKWLHRLKVMDQPAMTRWETSMRTCCRRFRPSVHVRHGREVAHYSPVGRRQTAGRGCIRTDGPRLVGAGHRCRVEVSTDGGATWNHATLQEPVLPRAHARFTWSWRWDGREATLQSRCTDDTGYVQPPRPDLVAVRGLNSNYHNNAIQSWKIAADGSVTNGNA
jgi:sulfane dehydrogenase subunit SoxC